MGFYAKLLITATLALLILDLAKGLQCFKCTGDNGQQATLCKDKLIECKPGQYCISTPEEKKFKKDCGVRKEANCTQTGFDTYPLYTCACNDVDGCNGHTLRMNMCTSCVGGKFDRSMRG